MNAVANPVVPEQTAEFTDLLAVPFPAEFAQGARNAVTTCLKIQADEKVTLITDRSCIAIAASMALELEKLGCRWNGFVLEELATRPLGGDAGDGARGYGELAGEHLRGRGAEE